MCRRSSKHPQKVLQYKHKTVQQRATGILHSRQQGLGYHIWQFKSLPLPVRSFVVECHTKSSLPVHTVSPVWDNTLQTGRRFGWSRRGTREVNGCAPCVQRFYHLPLVQDLLDHQLVRMAYRLNQRWHSKLLELVVSASHVNTVQFCLRYIGGWKEAGG